MLHQQIRTSEDVRALGTILSVWAHPDDETFSCAGIMAAAVANGQRVICITATKGEAGSHDVKRWPPDTIGEVRARELHAALECLGVKEHYWLEYIDGTLADVPEAEGAAVVLGYIDKYQPDTILTFGPDGITGHTDHISVSRWAGLAAAQADTSPTVYQAVETVEKYERYFKQADELFDIYFNIDQPQLYDEAECDIFFLLSRELCDQKRRALAVMPSQTEGMMEYFKGELFNKAFCSEAFVRADSAGR